MPQWEYQTLVVRQSASKVPEVIQINSKEAPSEVSGGLIKSKSFVYDLASYLGKAGREGWEVASAAPLTTYGAGGMAAEGAINVLVVLKRPTGERYEHDEPA